MHTPNTTSYSLLPTRLHNTNSPPHATLQPSHVKPTFSNDTLHQTSPLHVSPHPTHDLVNSNSSPTDNISHTPPSSHEPILPRRNSRSLRPPAHLNYYICNLVSFQSLPNVSQVFLVKQSQWFEPKSYKDAAKHEVWRYAMQKELQALNDINTWDLVSLPSGKKAIGSKWV